MMTFTADLVIGWLIGAVIVLAYTTVYFYLWGRRKKKDFNKLYEEYYKKSIQYNALYANHDCLLKQYGEMTERIKNDKSRQ